MPSSYLPAFSCSGQQAGVIKVDPDGDPCPPYSITYNQVGGGGPRDGQYLAALGGSLISRWGLSCCCLLGKETAGGDAWDTESPPAPDPAA